MKPEDKQLLLKDLSARLPYRQICVYKESSYEILGCLLNKVNISKPILSEIKWIDIEDCKPYLRPMDSITEEEKKIMRSCGFELIPYDTGYTGFANIENCIDEVSFRFMEEFLNSHYFDYRGLIPMGLALEAPEGMYN